MNIWSLSTNIHELSIDVFFVYFHLKTGKLKAMNYILPLTLLVGSLLAFQIKLNGLLFLNSNNALSVALISVWTTAIMLSLIYLGVYGLNLSLPSSPWWHYLGGLCGGIFLVSISYWGAKHDLTLLSMGLLAGQMLCSLALDRYLQGELSWPRIVGGVLILLAIAVNMIFK